MLLTHSKSAVSFLSSCLIKGNLNIKNFAKMSSINYETLSVSVPKEYVYHVELNRPEKRNAFNKTMWLEIGKCFEELNSGEDCRVIVLSGAGKLFTAGLDLTDAMQIAPMLAEKEDVARKAKIMMNLLITYQKTISSLEICRKPVLAAVHSGCLGAGVDLITAADMRYCTKDAWFQVKEVDLGMAADVGVLQRLPKIIGSDSLVRELCYTGRKLMAEEALSSGLVNKVFEDKDSMIKSCIEVAEEIAKKSPVAVQGTKVSLVYSRDHSVQEGLNHIALWNQLMLQSEDFLNGTVAQATKQKNIIFAKL